MQPTETSRASVTPTQTVTLTLTPTPTTVPDSVLADAVLASLPQYGGNWYILIRADANRDMVAYQADVVQPIASIIKVPVAMLFFKVLEAREIAPSDYDAYLSVRGIGRTYMQLLTAMLVNSEEDATATLEQVIVDSGIDAAAFLSAWGAPNTDLHTRSSTVRDVASLYESLYYGQAVTLEGRQIILDLLATYTPNDDTRFGVLRSVLPPGAEFYNKRSSLATPWLVMGDSALIAWEDAGVRHVYVLVALGFGGEPATTDVKIVQGIEDIARLFWDFIGR